MPLPPVAPTLHTESFTPDPRVPLTAKPFMLATVHVVGWVTTRSFTLTGSIVIWTWKTERCRLITYRALIPNSSHKFIVNLEKRYCDCGNFLEYLSPCAHAIVACRYKADDLYDYMGWIYSVEAYRKTYSRFLLPVNINNLPSGDGVLSTGIPEATR